MDRITPNGLGPLDDVEVWEPELAPKVTSRLGRPVPPPRLTVSVPGAIAGAFLVCALAFGSSLGTGLVSDRGGDDGSGSTGTGTSGADVALAGNGSGGASRGGVNPGAAGIVSTTAQTEQGEPIPEDPAPEPDPEPETEPTPDTGPATLKLELALREGDVKLAWSACDVDGFVAYKIVRSSNAGATYPRTGGDTLIGVVEAAGRTTFVDTKAPAGKKLWYAVFGIAKNGDATRVICASDDVAISTPAKPDPTPKPTDKPVAVAPVLGLTLAVKDGRVYVDWSTCKAKGAEAYKVVRSSDGTVRWPMGSGDSLIAVVGMDGKTAAWDKEAPGGKRSWYRAFCVRHSDDGYKVLASSKVKSIVAPKHDPAPKVESMWLEVGSEGGTAVLHWEACGADGFSHYRILRKTGEGTTVVAEIESSGTTTWVDSSVEVGGTYKYLVQAKGHHGDGYVLLGTSGHVAVTIE